MTGTALQQVALPSGDADAPVQLAALKDGRAYASVGGDVFLLDPDNGSATIESLQRAARIVGRELRMQLV